jgi:hypothetical protein
MKNSIKLFFALFAMTAAQPSAMAQNTLEYPGGPHSGITQIDADRLSQWSSNTLLELDRLEAKVAPMSDDLEIRDILLAKMKAIAGNSGLRPGDLLLRQSLYAGIMLSDIIDVEGLKKGGTPGEVSQQVDVLSEAIKMAKDYYVSDQTYVNGLLQNREDVQFNSRLIEFGVRLSTFIIAQSTHMLALDATASYGMLKWSLGVLNRKLLEDTRNLAFANTITYLNAELQPYPEMEFLTSDSEAIQKIRPLRTLAKQIFHEIDMTQKSLVQK